MRDRANWAKPLKKAMQDAPSSIAGKGKFASFSRTEMMLYALQTYFPNFPLRKAHLLLQGYREPNTTDIQWHVSQHLRHLAPEFQSAIAWEIALRDYDILAQSAASGWLGFEVDLETNAIAPTRKMVVSRYDLYQKALNASLRFQKKKYNPAPAGSYEFRLDAQQAEIIKIAPEIARIGAEHKASKLPRSSKHQAIKVPLSDLFQAGEKLESLLGDKRKNFRETLERSRYWDLEHNREVKEIVLDREAHILGPTGSGKSTLIQCLVKHLTDNQKRIAIAANSVSDVQDWLDFARKIAIDAVPVIGDGERHKHLSRLNQAEMSENERQPFTHPGFRWLSQCCPLYASSERPIPQPSSGERSRPPCFQKLRDKNDSLYDCPIAPVCPRHIEASELKSAQLIVGTLPGFIHRKVPAHALAESITFLEYLALTTDLFVIDEVDIAQPQLDEIFYPAVTLTSFNPQQTDTWTRDESRQHARGVMKGDVVVPRGDRDAYLEQSEDQRHLADRSLGTLMYSIRNIFEQMQAGKSGQAIEQRLKEYVYEGRLFTGWSFFNDLAKWISGKAQTEAARPEESEPALGRYEQHYERYCEIFQRVQNNLVEPDLKGLDPQDAAIAGDLVRVCGILLAGDFEETTPHRACTRFIQTTKWDVELKQWEPDDVDCFANHLAKLLQLAIYSTHALGALGKSMAARQQSGLDLETTFPLNPPRDFDRLLPNAPVGSVTSAQHVPHYDRGQLHPGQLKVYRGMAIGRALLSQWHSIFSIDGLTPANLLITSATSYSGELEQSYPFHVQLKPTLLVEPPPEKKQAVEESEFFYCPIAEDVDSHLVISGRPEEERKRNISRAIAGLCRRESQHSTPLLAQFQDYLAACLGSDRRNLLIATSSYDDTKIAYEHLGSFQERASYVVRDGQWQSDIRKRGDDRIVRSKLAEFPERDREFLLAPMGAISRAVNLMHPSSRDTPYFGGVVVLVRQHPKPDDNEAVICGVNKEAIDAIGQKRVEEIQQRARHARNMFLSVPQIFSRLPDRKIADISFKRPLVWTLTVNLTQLIGRSTRGGSKTVVWFIDGAFMPPTRGEDSAESSAQYSILLAARELLGDAIASGGVSRRLVETLYGPVYYPLTRLKHFTLGAKL